MIEVPGFVGNWLGFFFVVLGLVGAHFYWLVFRESGVI